MKIYEDGVTGPDLQTCDIVSYDLGDAEIQFCLPTDPECPPARLKSQEALHTWKSQKHGIYIAEASWEYRKTDEVGTWSVGRVNFYLRAFNLEVVDLEAQLGITSPFCMLDSKDLSRMAIEYFVKDAINEALESEATIDIDELLESRRIALTRMDLEVSKEDLLPWFTNRDRDEEVRNWSNITFIPISERAGILAGFDLGPMTYGDKPFYFSIDEAQKFGELLRKEFFSYFKITYSPEIQHKIKQLANG